MTREQQIEIAEMECSKYESAGDIRNKDRKLYNWLRVNNLCHIMPKGKMISKLSHTNEELIKMSDEFTTLKDMYASNRGLVMALRKRGIFPERLMSMIAKNAKERVKKGESTVKRAKPEPDPHVDIIPKDLKRKKRTGAFACFKAIHTEEGFICGRCKKEYNNLSKTQACVDLCKKCYYDFVQWSKDGEMVLNILGNIKDEYCNIVINFDDGSRMWIGLDADDMMKRKLISSGYGFIIKKK